MKSLFTTALAGLMLLGTISALATPNHSTQLTGYATDGPVPLCDPLSTPNCPSPMVKAKTDGPVPLCDPLSTPNCPSPMLKAK